MEQLREANPAATPDLTLANLSGADISSARLEMIKTGISVIMGNDEIRELAKQLADVSAIYMHKNRKRHHESKKPLFQDTQCPVTRG